MAIRSVFLDFGGCIDAPGIHTRTLFWDAFASAWGDRASFQEAYTAADQRMMATGEAKGLGLREFNRWNGVLIAEALGMPAAVGAERADQVSHRMHGYLLHSRDCLRELAHAYPLHVISNFTGNLERILEEYELRPLFASVTESFHAGCAKPDLAIFRLALSRQRLEATDCLYVGDNPTNDIAPAKALGMSAFLIHEPGHRRECGADAYLTDLRDLLSLIQSR